MLVFSLRYHFQLVKGQILQISGAEGAATPPCVNISNLTCQDCLLCREGCLMLLFHLQ